MGFKVTKITRRNWKSSYGDSWKEDFKKDVIALGGFKCSECKRPSTKDNPVQRHHIIPKAKGGRNARIFYKILCKQCHKRKHPRQTF